MSLTHSPLSNPNLTFKGSLPNQQRSGSLAPHQKPLPPDSAGGSDSREAQSPWAPEGIGGPAPAHTGCLPAAGVSPAGGVPRGEGASSGCGVGVGSQQFDPSTWPQPRQPRPLLAQLVSAKRKDRGTHCFHFNLVLQFLCVNKFLKNFFLRLEFSPRAKWLWNHILIEAPLSSVYRTDPCNWLVNRHGSFWASWAVGLRGHRALQETQDLELHFSHSLLKTKVQVASPLWINFSCIYKNRKYHRWKLF